MAGRTDEAKREIVFTLDNTLDGVTNSSDGHPRDLVGLSANDGVRFDVATTTLGEGTNGVDMFGGVGARNSIHRCRWPLGAPAKGIKSRIFKVLDGGNDAFRALGMVTRVVLEDNRIIVEKCHE
jgi:hypothetical protein